MMFTKKISLLVRLEYIIPIFAVASLLISCILISDKKYFWNDELYSYYLLADQSFKNMLVAFHDKINGTPILYFLIGWLWAKLFGATELSLRLFSSLGFCIALVVTWITLRQTYSLLPASFGVLTVFCVSEIILSQNAEARMYGLFIACCSLGLFQYNSLNHDLKDKSPIYQRKLWLNMLIHIGIVHTHLFGILYSGAVLFSHLASDIYFKKFRPSLYYSIILSWASLIFYIPSFLNQADAGNPRLWIPVPSTRELIDFLNSHLSVFLGLDLLILIILIAGLQFLLTPDTTASFYQAKPKKRNSELTLLIFAYSFLVIPVLVWVLSKTIKPIFIDRYMVPTTLSWSILFSFFFSRIIIPLKWTRLLTSNNTKYFITGITQNILIFSIIPLLLINPIRYASNYSIEELPGLNDKKYGYVDLPIIVQSSHDFLKRFFYSPHRNRYFFILDWESAVDESSGLFTPQEYKHLEALKRNYPDYFSDHIIKSQEFIKMNHKFLVLDSREYDKKCTSKPLWKNITCPQWLEQRILNNPIYEVKNLGSIDEDRTILLVEKQ